MSYTRFDVALGRKRPPSPPTLTELPDRWPGPGPYYMGVDYGVRGDTAVCTVQTVGGLRPRFRCIHMGRIPGGMSLDDAMMLMSRWQLPQVRAGYVDVPGGEEFADIISRYGQPVSVLRVTRALKDRIVLNRSVLMQSGRLYDESGKGIYRLQNITRMRGDEPDGYSDAFDYALWAATENVHPEYLVDVKDRLPHEMWGN